MTALDIEGRTGTGMPGVGRTAATLLGPVAIIWILLGGVGLVGGPLSSAASQTAVTVAIVVGLQLFAGNSGVLSFGHVAFVAVGAWVTGLATVAPALKTTLLPDLFPWLQSFALPTPLALLLGTFLAGVFALLVGAPLMRLDGLQAGIATLAVLIATNQVLTYWAQIGPQSGQSLIGVAQDLTLPWVLSLTTLVVIVSWLYRRSASARMLRASREDRTAAVGSGIGVTRHRLLAFALSAMLCGLAGGMWVQVNGVLQASQLSLDLTFAVLAVLVLGGVQSIWGATAGALAYAVVSQVLLQFEQGVRAFGYVFSLPQGFRTIVLGTFLVGMLMFRPQGFTGGREFGWPFGSRARRATGRR